MRWMMPNGLSRMMPHGLAGMIPHGLAGMIPHGPAGMMPHGPAGMMPHGPAGSPPHVQHFEGRQMRIVLASRLEDLEVHAKDWQRMAGEVPTRSWGWLASWWQTFGQEGHAAFVASKVNHYACRRQLFVPCVVDDAGLLIGLAPWYIQRHPIFGRVIRWLGSGRVCSDYLSLLCRPGQEAAVAGAIAEYLSAAAWRQPADMPAWATRWDLLELEAVEQEDRAVLCLTEQLAARRCLVRSRPGPNCWQIALPETWEDYLARFSRKRRTHVRKMMSTYVDTGRAVVRWADSAETCSRAMEILVDLHQRRRRQLGQSGCFALPAMTAFVHRAARALASAGQFAACWMELDGMPAAAEYMLLGRRTVYSYQSGMAPEMIEHEPGKLMNLLMVRWAIQHGYRTFDLMRGDEPYKQALHATPVATVNFRVVPLRAAARFRDGLWHAARSIKHWLAARMSGPSGQSATPANQTHPAKSSAGTA